MAIAMEDYPDACAVLVRRHGVYVWGPTWEKAKTMYVIYIYIYQVFIKENDAIMLDCHLNSTLFLRKIKDMVHVNLPRLLFWRAQML